MLSRACDITSLAEKDLDLSTRDAKLVADVKILMKEIGKLKLNPWLNYGILSNDISVIQIHGFRSQRLQLSTNFLSYLKIFCASE